MVGGIRYEHTHRVIASLVGLFTLILTISIGKKEARAGVRWLAIAAVGTVVLQGILGGLAVLCLLPLPVSVAHACLGPIFFSLAVSLAVVTSPKWEAPPLIDPPLVESLTFQRLCELTTVFVFLQMLLGAIVRHTERGIWLHIIFAFVMLLTVSFLMTRAFNHFADEGQILRPVLFLGFLILLEFFLGIGAFIFTRLIENSPPGLGRVIFPTIHQTLGAVILATSVVLTLRSRLRRKSFELPHPD
jgi:cytochrome c oxidase assembly protein subunit 15